MGVTRSNTLPPIGQPPRHGGPTVLRIMLGARLRRLRESKEITRQAAGHTIRASEAKMSRLELGRVGYKLRDVADLLTLYGVDDEQQRDAFLHLADQANSRGWWHKYSSVLPPWFETYVGLEQAASAIRTYQAQFVPGLFQTEPYSRAVALLGHPRPERTDADLRVDLRMARQELLAGPEAPRVSAVVDEAALRRPVGGPSVMRGQLRRLIELSELPSVTLQVVPFLAGGHAAAGGSFSILSFADPELPDVAYMEQLTSAVYLDKSGDLDSYLRVMAHLCAEAASPSETRHLLSTILKES